MRQSLRQRIRRPLVLAAIAVTEVEVNTLGQEECHYRTPNSRRKVHIRCPIGLHMYWRYAKAVATVLLDKARLASKG